MTSSGRRFNRGAAWGLMIIGALLAFEIFNFSTTQFALLDVLGDLEFAGMRWASILAIAFCGMDFAGIARIFTPEQGADEPKEVYYLFGAWLLAAAFNAMLTDMVGSFGCHCHHTSQAVAQSISNETMTKVCADLCGRHDPAHPRADHRNILRSQVIACSRPTNSSKPTTTILRPRAAADLSSRQQQQPILRPASSLNRPQNMNAQSSNPYRADAQPCAQTGYAANFIRAPGGQHHLSSL